MNKPALCSTSCDSSRNSRHNKQVIKLEHKDTMNIKKEDTRIQRTFIVFMYVVLKGNLLGGKSTLEALPLVTIAALICCNFSEASASSWYCFVVFCFYLRF
jgi:hypothetical protein